MMSASKKHKPWSDRVHESVVSRNKNGQLNLVIKGGAEEIKFPYFGPVKQDKVIYHSGKIQDGEILLEVNDQSVVGLTLYDLNNLIKQARDPVRFKTVREGQTLVKDLKLYLSQRFNKNTVDHQLQAAIRDNLYLRTLPCTTRKLRDGEIDGVDYTFLTVEEFQELEKSGALLESGVYEGNYYGTPKPPPVPLSPPSVQRSNSANDLPGLHPSSDGKRKRNRSNIEQQSSSAASTPRRNHIFSPPKENEKKSLSVTTKEPQSPTKMTANGDVKTKSPPLNKERGMQESLLNSEKILGPLPEGWEMAQTESGDFYFIDHPGKKTSWLDPRLDSSARKKLEDCDDDELPYGWEKVDDSQFGVYYVDHIDKKTQFANPVLEAKKKLTSDEQMSDESKNEQQQNEQIPSSDANQTEPSLDNGSPLSYTFTNDPAKLQGVSHLVPLEKSSRGFGFTIVGGDDPEEFLQIKSVVPDGPAARTGNIEQGDVIAKVNDTCVLGWTHPDVVKLFQAIPIGQIVTLQLCRGYPLMVDSDDPATNIVTTYAISPDDKPVEEFERQLRMLNNQLEQNNGDGYYTGMDGVVGNDNLSSPSKSMPDITANQNYRPGFYGNPDMSQAGGFIPQNIYARSGSLGALPAPIVMQVIIEKGDEGFGFTIADSPQGQRVKQILDAPRCHELMEGDILLEINGTTVQNMPHNNVVLILKECPSNSAAIFVIQRGPLLTYDPGTAMGVRPNYMNGPVPSIPQSYAYPNQGYRGRMKRSQTEPGLGSEGGSVVSAPPGSTLGPPGGNHPVSALLQEYRSKHVMDRNDHFNPPVTSMYQPYGGQNIYHDPYINQNPPADNYIDLNVVLRREESGFGFRILGGNAQDETVTIGAIVTSGAAHKEGTLQTGDELLTVDGQKVTRMGHNQVIALMGNAARNAVVRLGIRRRVGATQMMSRPTRGQMSRQMGPVSSRPSSRGPGGPPVHNGQPFDIVIHRLEHEGFGFVIISSVKTSGAGFQAPHKIGRIIDGSPAARCGHLRVGDRILAVNNVDITHLHHGQIVNLIKDSGFAIALRVLPLESDEDGLANNPQDDSDFRIVELQRSRKGFGFGIRGGREYNMPLYILRVAKDGPAAECEEINVGDILIDINGRSTVDIPHTQAINLIKHGGTSVKLVLKKGDGTVPEIEINPSGSVQSLSSGAMSGSDPPNRSTRYMQLHSDKRAPPTSAPSHQPPSSMKSPTSVTQTPASKSSRHTQSSVRHLRRRANSSGQVVPDDPNSPPALRMRRAVTPNPTQAPKEVVISPSGSDVGANPLSPARDVRKPNKLDLLPHNAEEIPRSQSVKSKTDPTSSSKNSSPQKKTPSPAATSSATSPNRVKENGSTPLGNHDVPGAAAKETADPVSSPNEQQDVLASKASLGEGVKKGKPLKKSKSGKSKATKVGLWLSPKKKQK